MIKMRKRNIKFLMIILQTIVLSVISKTTDFEQWFGKYETFQNINHHSTVKILQQKRNLFLGGIAHP